MVAILLPPGASGAGGATGKIFALLVQKRI
jgi:hypothetical protein